VRRLHAGARRSAAIAATLASAVTRKAEVFMKVMSPQRCAAIAAAMTLGAIALPARADTFTQWAPVVSATPIYRHVSAPRQQCWNETVTTDEYVERRSAFGTASIDLAPVARDVERCRTIDTGNDVLEGYDVIYRYQNRDVRTRLPYDPGQRMQVRVDVAPEAR
jgi:uncharacterized protein YcfJ